MDFAEPSQSISSFPIGYSILSDMRQQKRFFLYWTERLLFIEEDTNG
jgi:hypothetical protein